MRFCVIAIFLVTVLFSEVNAQNNGRVYTDSILSQLPHINTDTELIDVYTILASEYNDIDLDSALFYGKKALTLAEKRNERSFLIGGYCVASRYCLL